MIEKEIKIAGDRADFFQSVRDYFRGKGYLEVETPILSPFLIPEPSIEVFATEYVDPYNPKKKCYLVPSPELWMKRLLAQGFSNIFQISKCFRNSESISKIHNPEFSMIEWYTVDSNYINEIDVVEGFIKHVYRRAGLTPVFDLAVPFHRLSMKEGFFEFAHLDLDSLMAIEPLRRAALNSGVLFADDDSWEELFNKIFLTLVEPRIPPEEPVILYDYPSLIPTLAKKKKGEYYYERWELYLNGIELANCYSEETSQDKLAAFIEHEALRKQGGKVIHTIDEGFSRIFHSRYPHCAGTALGLDRLFMSVYGITSIDETLLFPFKEIFSRA